MAKGDTKTNQYLDIAANGTRADLPTDTCCETRTQTLIRGVAERIMDVEDEVEEIKNNPDVVDIVPTYAALQAYDTSQLTDKDIIRVLADETHDGASTYYRWSTQTQAFTYIGEVGDYYTEDEVDALLALKADKATTYTKTETDALLDGKQDVLTAGENITIVDESGSLVISAEGGSGVIELTSADYNYPADNPDGIALWLLDAGVYVVPSSESLKIYYGTGYATESAVSSEVYVITPASGSTKAAILITPRYLETLTTLRYTNLTTGTCTYEQIPNVVQTTGMAQNAVMSQNATTRMVFADPNTKNKVQIGTTGVAGVADNVGLGYGAAVTGGTTRGAISLGAYSNATQTGQMDIGTTVTYDGYNSSTYRLLTGLYDGQNAHDAATYGQVISYSAINGAGAPTTATEGKYVGQLYYDTTNEAMYFLKTIDTTTDPATYTWEALGGGSSVNVVQTIGTSTTDVMSQNATTQTLFDGTGSSTRSHIAIGTYAATQGNKNTSASVSVGDGARANSNFGIAIGGYGSNGNFATTAKSGIAIGGYNPNASGEGSIAIGSYGATASGKGSIALGYTSSATMQGQMDIGSTSSGYGYNNSAYRLLTGLYDPQSAHDAATKGYVDPTTDSSAPTTATVGRLGQIQIDTTTATAYMCVEADDVTPAYTWKQITA